MALIFPMVLGIARASEVNMWFDETGEVHFSDMPLADVKAPRVPQSETFRAGMKAQGKSRGGLSIIAGTTAPDPTSDAEPVHTEDQQNAVAAQANAERRHKMIEDCEQNNGVDCEREVDTELGAEAIQRGGHVIHQMRSAGSMR
ncbi:MAG: DUF4124 domain-containing protein [Betaproteobacteria bacterium]|nr:DUF4124 domain-containing protein [Betaproteobacteria bacterium]